MNDHLSRQPRGFVLMFALCLVVALGAIGAAMLRGVSVRERIAANAVEKRQAVQVAQDALQYGETWLAQAHAGAAVECVAPADAMSGGMRICKRELAQPLSPPWQERTDNLPLFGEANDGSARASHTSRAAVHIHDLGVADNGMARLFQITAVGYADDGVAVSVLRSTYQSSAAAYNLGLE